MRGNDEIHNYKKRKSHLLFFLLVTQCLLAQENQLIRNGEITFAQGLSILGPSPKMKKLMATHGFGDDISIWPFDPIKYPIYNGIGGSFQLGYHHHVGNKHKVGIIVNYTSFGKVIGHSKSGGSLHIKFDNKSIIPIYSIKLRHDLELSGGPALMINSGCKKESNLEEYTRLTFGLLCGFNIIVLDKPKYSVKLNASYFLTYENKMGPFSGSNSKLIPENNYNFSNMNLLFVIGAKL